MGAQMRAESIARALGGRKAGSGWSARCPAHDDRTPSLSLRETGEGKVLVRCHAGCDQDQVIAQLKASGLWTQNGPRVFRHAASRRVIKPTEPDHDDSKRTEAALSIWQAAKPAGGTLVESYLRARGLRLPAILALRFHPRLKHPSGDSWPAMIALVTRGSDDAPLAIHRTFLAIDGAAKAPVENPKMMLGQCQGGAVKFGNHTDQIAVAEGLETALSVYQSLQLPTWAALSTSGLIALNLPPEIRRVAIAADGDAAGEKAAQVAAKKWLLEGRTVRIARPPIHKDFNDLLMQAPQKDEA